MTITDIESLAQYIKKAHDYAVEQRDHAIDKSDSLIAAGEAAAYGHILNLIANMEADK